MADPTNPTDPTVLQQQADLVNKLADDYVTMGQSAGTADQIMGKLGTTLNSLNDQLSAAGISLSNLTNLTTQQTQQFALITTGLIQAREAFTGFANVDYSGLSTLSEQLKDINDALFAGGTVAAQAAAGLEGLAKSLFGAEKGQTLINEAKKKGGDIAQTLLTSIQKEGQGLLTHADNMARMETAYIQMAGATGNLNEVWTAAGDNLQNLNTITEKYTTAIADTIGATGLSSKQVEAYYGELGQIPGALTSVIDTTGKGEEATSMLTASIQVATGTGRAYKDVMTDLKTAFKDYGLVGEDALKFSVRMSDVSTRLKAPIEDVTTALRGSADAFKMFVTGQADASSSAESLAKNLNEYGKALESTGLSATQATEVAGQLAQQVAKLSVGQLAFISQRTGGAGGLMGAAQETLKLQSDPGQVVKDAMNTLQQQFGKIVTLKDAATSEAAANQNIKQTLMLQQLLGPLAKDQATANRLLEAMKNQAAGQPGAIAKALSPTGVQDAEDKGLKIQQGTYTEMSRARAALERMRYLADQGAGRTFQQNLTARASASPITENQGLMKTGLASAMLASRSAAGGQVRSTALDIAGGNVSDTLGSDMGAAIQGALANIKEIPAAFSAIVDTLKGAVVSGDTGTIKTQQQDLEQRKRDAEESLKMTKGNADAQRKALAEIAGASKILNAISPLKTSTDGTPLSSSTGVKEASKITTHEHIAAAIQRSAAQAPTTVGAGTTAVAGATPHAKTNETTINLVGKFTMDCPHCGKPADISNQAKIYPQQFIAQH